MKALRLTAWKSEPELAEVLDLGADAVEAYRSLAAGKVEGRLVVVP